VTDRELDMRVAVEVMGWHQYTPPAWLGLQWYWTDGEPVEDAQSYTVPHECAKNSWHPFTDIAAAWEVMEKILTGPPLRPWGDSSRLVDVCYVPQEGWLTRIHENHWNWPFGPENEPQVEVTVKGEATAPRAICFAVLAAVAVTP